jgi:hypothetical protein
VTERTPASLEQLTGLKNHQLWAALAVATQPQDRAPIIAELTRRHVYSYTDDMASRLPGYMTTSELIDALQHEPQKTDRWHRLCKEAHERTKAGAFPPNRVPATFDPQAHIITEPLDLANLDT